MKKLGFVFAALAVALMFSGGSAEAAKRAKVVVTPAPWYAPWWGYWASDALDRQGSEACGFELLGRRGCDRCLFRAA